VKTAGTKLERGASNPDDSCDEDDDCLFASRLFYEIIV